MATIPAPRAHGTSGSLAARLKGNPAYQAFWLLRTGFTVAPILFGLDKFSHLLVNFTSAIREYSRARVSPSRIGGLHHARPAFSPPIWNMCLRMCASPLEPARQPPSIRSRAAQDGRSRCVPRSLAHYRDPAIGDCHTPPPSLTPACSCSYTTPRGAPDPPRGAQASGPNQTTIQRR